MPVTNLGQNSFGHFGADGAFLTEFILTFIFILVILVVTSKKGNGGFSFFLEVFDHLELVYLTESTHERFRICDRE